MLFGIDPLHGLLLQRFLRADGSVGNRYVTYENFPKSPGAVGGLPLEIRGRWTDFSCDMEDLGMNARWAVVFIRWAYLRCLSLVR